MELLIRIYLPAFGFIFLSLVLNAYADNKSSHPIDQHLSKYELKSCNSAEEFKSAIEYIKSEEALNFSDVQVLKEALAITSGCDGAHLRFKKVYEVLKKSGADYKRSFEIALRYSKKSNAAATAFVEIYKAIFLEGFLNLDFRTAFELSSKLTLQNDIDPEIVKNDFVGIVKFCTEEKEMALNFSSCAKIAIEMTQYSYLYKSGMLKDFKEVYKMLRTHTLLGMSISESLNFLPSLLKSGPLARENFERSLSYLLEKDSVKLPSDKVAHLALEIAKNSLAPLNETTK